MATLSPDSEPGLTVTPRYRINTGQFTFTFCNPTSDPVLIPEYFDYVIMRL